MINKLRAWFDSLNKDIHTKPMLTKIGTYVLLGLLSFFVGMEFIFKKEKSDKAKLQNGLVKDAVSDAKTEAQLTAIDSTREATLAASNIALQNVNTLNTQITHTELKETKDIKAINGIQSWDDVDKVVK